MFICSYIRIHTYIYVYNYILRVFAGLDADLRRNTCVQLLMLGCRDSFSQVSIYDGTLL